MLFFSIAFFTIPLAFATHDPNFNHPTPFGSNITITLDQETYTTGETIKISGNVNVTELESLATVTLYRPDQNVVTSTLMMPNDNGTVSYQFKAGIGNMNVTGKYTIELEYYNQSVLKSFFFKDISDEPPFFGLFEYLENLFSWM